MKWLQKVALYQLEPMAQTSSIASASLNIIKKGENLLLFLSGRIWTNFHSAVLVWLMGRKLELLKGLSSMDDKSSVRKFTGNSTSKKLFLYFRPLNHNMYQSEFQLFSSSFSAFNIQRSQQIATEILHILSLLAVFRDARQVVRWYFRQTGHFYSGGWRAASTETFMVS